MRLSYLRPYCISAWIFGEDSSMYFAPFLLNSLLVLVIPSPFQNKSWFELKSRHLFCNGGSTSVNSVMIFLLKFV